MNVISDLFSLYRAQIFQALLFFCIAIRCETVDFLSRSCLASFTLSTNSHSKFLPGVKDTKMIIRSHWSAVKSLKGTFFAVHKSVVLSKLFKESAIKQKCLRSSNPIPGLCFLSRSCYVLIFTYYPLLEVV